MNDSLNLREISALLKNKYGIVGIAGPMADAVQLLMQSAPTDLSVLITGETGTGKELFANALHGLSERKKHPFVSVNCGAIPETLLESELFGHEKGAFTSAVDSRRGFFEVADKGTIFLDEIGEMPVGTQVKLLRVLESGEFTRLGSSSLKKVDVRIIAATNRELDIEVNDGNFRQDLYFRLNAVHIVLPPLRKHIADIPILVDFFALKVAEKLGVNYEGISSDAVNILKSMHWPGNVRELRNLIETVITLEEASYITPELLSNHIARALPPPAMGPMPKETSLIHLKDLETPQKFELEIIFRTLLEIKNDMIDVKDRIHELSDKVDRVKAEILEMKPETPVEIDYGDMPVITDDNLSLNDIEKKMIIYALGKYEGNRRMAANALGISERTLYRKLTELELGDT